MNVCVCNFGYGLAVDYKENLNAINAKQKTKVSKAFRGEINLQNDPIWLNYMPSASQASSTYYIT